MKYTMTCKRNTLTIDTVTGNISGDTYPMREIIKDEFKASWDKEKKVWHADNLAETVEKFYDRFVRLYKLEPEEVEEPVVEAETTEVEAVVDTESKTAETANAKSKVGKTVSHTRLVDGNDGFYQMVYYTDGTSRKFFVG